MHAFSKPVSPFGLKFNHKPLFIGSHLAMFKARVEVINPTQPATLSSSFQTYNISMWLTLLSWGKKAHGVTKKPYRVIFVLPPPSNLKLWLRSPICDPQTTSRRKQAEHLHVQSMAPFGFPLEPFSQVLPSFWLFLIFLSCFPFLLQERKWLQTTLWYKETGCILLVFIFVISPSSEIMWSFSSF